MTNIWTDSYKEIRKPFFETESLDEEKAKRDYDGDGKVESGAKEYRGVIHNAIQKKKGGKPDGQDTSSVKEDVEQVDEKIDVTRQSSKRKSFGKYKGKYESPKKFRKTEIKDSPYQSKGNYNAHLAKEEYIGEVNDSKEKTLDVKKGIKNKVVINPQVKEEVETWVDQLVEEGYDLSQFTWDEMFEIYESAEQLDEGTAGMPAAGDAQTVTVDPLATAKAKAAKAKVAKERADLQVAQQSQRMKVATTESFDAIVEYLSQRPNAFENLEEGVFDPKKSKMRSAAARSQRTMTDAQRKAAKKESERTAAIHSKGETVLAGMRSSGTKGKVKTTPASKAAAPKANRTVKGRYDKLAKAASDVLKDIKK